MSTEYTKATRSAYLDIPVGALEYANRHVVAASIRELTELVEGALLAVGEVAHRGPILCLALSQFIFLFRLHDPRKTERTRRRCSLSWVRRTSSSFYID